MYVYVQTTADRVYCLVLTNNHIPAVMVSSQIVLTKRHYNTICLIEFPTDFGWIIHAKYIDRQVKR